MSMMRLRRSRLRSWIKKIPRPRHIRGTWLHRMFGEHLFSPELWRPSRHGVACGAATGLFWACMPMPFQMIPAGVTAYLCRFNVPTAISLVWVTNPVTWPFILYWQYRLGLWLLDKPLPADVNMGQLFQVASGVPAPLLLGCMVTGVMAAVSSFALVSLAWVSLVERWWRNHGKSPSASLPRNSAKNKQSLSPPPH